jgi:hypothetical protein
VPLASVGTKYKSNGKPTKKRKRNAYVATAGVDGHTINLCPQLGGKGKVKKLAGFFDNETMGLGMTELYGSLRRCLLTSPDTASSWKNLRLEKNGHATRAPAIVVLFVSNPCS